MVFLILCCRQLSPLYFTSLTATWKTPLLFQSFHFLCLWCPLTLLFPWSRPASHNQPSTHSDVAYVPRCAGALAELSVVFVSVCGWFSYVVLCYKTHFSFLRFSPNTVFLSCIYFGISSYFCIVFCNIHLLYFTFPFPSVYLHAFNSHYYSVAFNVSKHVSLRRVIR